MAETNTPSESIPLPLDAVTLGHVRVLAASKDFAGCLGKAIAFLEEALEVESEYLELLQSDKPVGAERARLLDRYENYLAERYQYMGIAVGPEHARQLVAGLRRSAATSRER